MLDADDGRSGRRYNFCSLSFQPLPYGTFFPKTMFAFLFSPFGGDSQKKKKCYFVFFNKKLDKTQMIKCFSKNPLTEKQYQHPYIIPGHIYFVTITSYFASTILTVPKSVFQVFTEIVICNCGFLDKTGVIDVLFADKFLVWKLMADAVCGFW